MTLTQVAEAPAAALPLLGDHATLIVHGNDRTGIVATATSVLA